jgi:hypothetical protein
MDDFGERNGRRDVCSAVVAFGFATRAPMGGEKGAVAAFQVLKREWRHTVTKLWRIMYGGESGKLPVPA